MMPDGTRRLGVPFALGFLLALASLYVTYDYDAPPIPRVNVHWAEGVTPSQRESLATAYHLAEPAAEEGRTWQPGLRLPSRIRL